MAKKDKDDDKKKGQSTIALNKRARFDYFIEDRFEAGIALEGWEVKSLRAGKIQIAESYDLKAGQMLKLVRQHGLEGVVAKRATSTYEPGQRSGSWMKSRTPEKSTMARKPA